MKLRGSATLLFDRDYGLHIELEDRLSGVTIKATVDTKQTLAALSRQAHVDCEIEYPSDLHLIGKEREIQRVEIDKTWDEWEPSRAVIKAQCLKEGILSDGFELWSDGTRTQQNTRGKHGVVLERYIDV